MKSIIALSLIALCCIGCKHQKGDILLRLKYYPSEKIDVRYRTYTLTGNENDEPMINEMVRFGLKVDSVTHDSLFHLSAKIDYIRAKNGGLLGSEYSSDKDEEMMSPQEKAMHTIFKPMIDSSYKLTINNRGEVREPLTYTSGATVSRPPINYTNYQPIFPKDKVAIGEEWTETTGLSKTKNRRECAYHIESIYQSIIQIKVTGKMEMITGGMKEFSGRYMIDQKTSELVSAKIEIPLSKCPRKLTAVIDIESH
ncbi:hypothetical protein AAFN85_18445 [Mucilaginibacter sp. CAU 1740]|uniref:hypothetical protein n=1 Tax=Mucilaginibacter sp. CAU 1740 TaxID=3140365 RepID=UPI00325B62D3